MPNGDRGKASLEVTLASWWASDPRGSRIATRTASPPVAPGSPAGGKPPLTRGRSSSSWTAPAGSAPSKRGNCAPQSGVGSTCAERRDRGKVQRPLGQGQLDQQLRLAGSAGSGGKSLEGHGRGAYRGRSAASAGACLGETPQERQAKAAEETENRRKVIMLVNPETGETITDPRHRSARRHLRQPQVLR